MSVTDPPSVESTLPAGSSAPSAASARTPIRKGATIGRYVVLDRLGAGGMGVVYAAYDPQLDRRVALKLLHPAIGDAEQGRRRLLREARALARLHHHHVVSVHDVGVHDETVFVAMELVEGRSLRAWLQEAGGRRPWHEAIAVFAEAATGLAAAHDAGLVHRDFKPDNVMLDASGRARVMDFGLARAVLPSAGPPTIDRAVVLEPAEDVAARALERVRGRLAAMGRIAPVQVEAPPATVSTTSLAQPLTVRGSVIGTPAYMAPEQIRGEEANARVDQFAFCVALFEALHGRRPFSGRTISELATAITEGRIDPVAEGSIPRRLHALVMRGLATDPEARHPSMHAIAAELERLPGRRRRIGATILGAAGLLGALAITQLPDRTCTRAAESLGTAWDDTRRSSVDTGLAAVEGFGAATAERTVAALDDYAQQWIAEHEDACRATHERGEQSQDLLDRRMVCLEQRRRELDALTKLMGQPDAAMAERAIEAVAHLPDPTACGDRAALLAEADGPSDPDARARIEAARDSIARALAHELAGRYDDGLAHATAAIEVADALDHAWVRAEAELAAGRLHEGAGRADEAARALRRAAHDGRVAGHDDAAAQAEVELVFVEGYLQSRTDDGRLWAEHARAAVERVHRADVLRARLENHVGVVLHRAGEVDAALDHLERALELRRTTLSDQHLDVSESHHNLGVAMRARGQLDDARAHHEAALAIRRAVLGNDHPKVAESMSALAVVALAAGETEASTRHFEAALAIQRAAWGDDHPKVAATLTNLGNAESLRGLDDRAETHQRDALAILRRTLPAGDVQIARACHNFANVLVAKGDHAAAEELYREAADTYAAAIGPGAVQVAQSLAELAQARLALGRIDDAIEPARRAAEIVDRQGIDPQTTGRARLGLARVLAARGGHDDETRRLAERAREAYLNASVRDDADLASVDAFLASAP